jgi:hypothetical protein
MIVALDDAVRGASPDLVPSIRYKILMYGLKGDYRNWVCAVDVTKKRPCLRFLYGTMLDDPQHRLRPGSTTMGTLDFKSIAEIDPALIADYVKEAVAKFEDFKASNAKE